MMMMQRKLLREKDLTKSGLLRTGNNFANFALDASGDGREVCQVHLTNKPELNDVDKVIHLCLLLLCPNSMQLNA